jgi:hypothetical protein
LLVDGPVTVEDSAFLETAHIELVHVPDAWSALLAAYLPGTYTGSEDRSLELHLSGPILPGDSATMLARASGKGRVELGHYTSPELETEGGRIDIELKGGRALLGGELDANGGSLSLDGDLLLVSSSPTASRVSFDAKDAEARTALSPLFARVHPAFAGLSQIENGSLSGLITSRLELSYPGDQSLLDLGSGAATFEAARLNGDGSFGLSHAGIRGAPFFDQLLQLAGAEAGSELGLDAVPFSIRSGALTYDNPWKWSLGGLTTFFSGAVGFDQKLALNWSLPLSEGFLKKQGLPKELAGQTLALPIGGTVSSPKLDWKAPLTELAKDSLKEAVQDELKDELGSLEEKLRKESGGLLDDKASGDAAEVLRRADELWSAGKQAEARPLYKRLREEFKLSPTYLLNRDRIKERAKGE